MFAASNSGHGESVREEIRVECPTQADWFLVVTFVEESTPRWGSRTNEEAEVV